MATIVVGKNFFQTNFEQAVQKANDGDIISVQEGVHTLKSKVVIDKSITIRGLGSRDLFGRTEGFDSNLNNVTNSFNEHMSGSGMETVISGQIVFTGDNRISLESLTLESNDDQIGISDGCSVSLFDTICGGKTGGFWLKNSTLSLVDSKIYGDEYTVVYVNQNSELSAKNSVIQGQYMAMNVNDNSHAIMNSCYVFSKEGCATSVNKGCQLEVNKSIFKNKSKEKVTFFADQSHVQLGNGCQIYSENSSAVKLVSRASFQSDNSELTGGINNESTILYIDSEAKAELSNSRVLSKIGSAAGIKANSQLIAKKTIFQGKGQKKVTLYANQGSVNLSDGCQAYSEYSNAINLVNQATFYADNSELTGGINNELTILHIDGGSKAQLEHSKVQSEAGAVTGVKADSQLIAKETIFKGKDQKKVTLFANQSSVSLSGGCQVYSEHSNAVNLANRAFFQADNCELVGGEGNESIILYIDSNSKAELSESRVVSEIGSVSGVKQDCQLIAKRTLFQGKSRKNVTIYADQGNVKLSDGCQIYSEYTAAVKLLNKSFFQSDNSELRGGDSNESSILYINSDSKAELSNSKVLSEKGTAAGVGENGQLIAKRTLFKNKNQKKVTLYANQGNVKLSDGCQIQSEGAYAVKLFNQASFQAESSELTGATNDDSIILHIDSSSKANLSNSKVFSENGRAAEIKENSQLIARKTIFKGKGRQKATLYANQGNMQLSDESQVYSEYSNAINLVNQASFQGDNSELLGGANNESTILYIDSGARAELSNSKIMSEVGASVGIESNSHLIAKGTLFKNKSQDRVALYANQGNVQLSNGCQVYSEHSNAVNLGSQSFFQSDNSELRGGDSNEFPILYIDSESKAELSNSTVVSWSGNALSMQNGSNLLAEKTVFRSNSEYYTVAVQNSELELSSSQLLSKMSSTLFVNSTGIVNSKNSEFISEEQQLSGVDTMVAEDGATIYMDSQDNIVQEEKTENENINENSQTSTEEAPLDQLNKMQGLTKIKEQIKKLVNIVKFNQNRIKQGLSAREVNYHALFQGNPGTGKTEVARILEKIFYQYGVIKEDKLIETDRSGLVSENVGGTALKTKAVLDSALGGVLLIDEAYTLVGSGNDTGKEAIETILKFMEDHRDNVVIIFAGYAEKMNDFLKMNPGLESRIPNVFNFEDYTAEEIANIGYSSLSDSDYYVDEAKYKKVVKEQYNLSNDRSNGRWVRNFNQKLINEMSSRVIDTGSEDVVTIIDDDLNNIANGNRIEKQEELNKQMQSLQAMIGLQNVKEEVNSLVKQAQADKILSEKLPSMKKPAHHMIFEGNPGTGKTTVAEIIAKMFYNLDILPTDNVLTVERKDLIGQYIGETEVKTAKIIDRAIGGVLFIDEAYQLTQNTSSNDFGSQAIESLLTALENHRENLVVILAGYTNEMEEFLDTNPGLRSRIPNRIIFPDYSPDEVAEIVDKILSKTWQYNRETLRKLVALNYAKVDVKEKGNGRWARNCAEMIEKAQKDRIISEDLSENEVYQMPDKFLEELLSGSGSEQSKQEELNQQLQSLQAMIGLQNVKEEVNSLVKQAQADKILSEKLPSMKKPAHHMIFEGNPGTGKTTVAELIAKMFYNLDILPTDNVLTVERKDLIGQYIGETEVKTAKIIDRAIGGVLFIDEAYQLTQNASANDFGSQAVESLLTALENHREDLVVILAGYTNEMEEFLDTNPGLRSRIPNRIIFPDYSPDEVAEIVDKILSKTWQYNRETLRKLVALNYAKVDVKEKGNGRWARNCAEMIEKAQKDRIISEDLSENEVYYLPDEFLEQLLLS